jgi:hypothetical protein
MRHTICLNESVCEENYCDYKQEYCKFKHKEKCKDYKPDAVLIRR